LGGILHYVTKEAAVIATDGGRAFSFFILVKQDIPQKRIKLLSLMGNLFSDQVGKKLWHHSYLCALQRMPAQV